MQQGGKQVKAEDIARARQEGATDLEIHDTVLIAAAFCMYNRYVDGWQPGSRTIRNVPGTRRQDRAGRVWEDGVAGERFKIQDSKGKPQSRSAKVQGRRLAMTDN